MGLTGWPSSSSVTGNTCSATTILAFYGTCLVRCAKVLTILFPGAWCSSIALACQVVGTTAYVHLGGGLTVVFMTLDVFPKVALFVFFLACLVAISVILFVSLPC